MLNFIKNNEREGERAKKPTRKMIVIDVMCEEGTNKMIDGDGAVSQAR